MELDPDELFPINHISRADIALLLNQALRYSNRKDINRFSHTDPRLTKTICRELANTLSLDFPVDEERDKQVERQVNLFVRWLSTDIPSSLLKKPRKR